MHKINLLATLMITTATTFAMGFAAQAQEAVPLTFDTVPNGYSFDLSANGGAGVITFGLLGDSKAGSMPGVTTSSITSTSQGYNMTLPSYGGTSTWSVDSDSAFAATSPNGTHLNGDFAGAAAANLTYSNYGAWQTTGTSDAGMSLGVFASGVPGVGASDRPADGIATYTGKAAGFHTDIYSTKMKLNGDVMLTANFGANTIAGQVTNMTAAQIDLASGTVGAAIATNDIALSNGLITGTSFAGDAKIVWSPTQQMSLGGAAGTFGGAFYGVGAAEAAGTISMTNPGNSNIIASFGAAK
jgi:hypothetical protein